MSDPLSGPSGCAPRRVTVPAIRAMKARGERVAMITAYDYVLARMLDEAGADMLLVGDSLGMVVQGHDSPLPVTLDDVVYHSRAVARGTRRAHIVADMPFLSYQVSADEAVRNAGRLVKEGGAFSVKLEGGLAVADTIRRIVGMGVPVVGHVGLTPQSVHAMGGFRVQGRTPEGADRVRQDALAVADAGAFALVLEGIPGDLAADITGCVAIPTIGIGAGPGCDGQVLVCHDLLGLFPDLKPRFAKRYAELYSLGVAAAATYCREVKDGVFPGPEHVYGPARHEGPTPGRPLAVSG